MQRYANIVKQAPPEALAAVRRRDYPIVTEDFLSVADKAPTPEARKQALDSAQLFADFMKDEVLLARVRAAREKKR